MLGADLIQRFKQTYAAAPLPIHRNRTPALEADGNWPACRASLQFTGEHPHIIRRCIGRIFEVRPRGKCAQMLRSRLYILVVVCEIGTLCLAA